MIVKSLLAGTAIGVGCLAFANIGGIFGAVLFSIGLFSVFWLNLNLYTGKLPFCSLKSDSDMTMLLVILLCNAIGALFLLAYQPMAQSIVAEKLSQSTDQTFMASIICGALIYLAVRCKLQGNTIATLLIVPAFICSLSEHSIADICFMVMARNFSSDAIMYIATVAFGNYIGGRGLYLIDNKYLIDKGTPSRVLNE